MFIVNENGTFRNKDMKNLVKNVKIWEGSVQTYDENVHKNAVHFDKIRKNNPKEQDK